MVQIHDAKESTIILTGASGSGKTAIAEHLRQMPPPLPIQIFSFDTIGVPSENEMTRLHGSPQAWQEQTTMHWVAKLKEDALSISASLLEGQMRIAFILDALKSSDIKNAEIILVDCNDAVRWHRLTDGRKQPDLANENMLSWAAFLRREAATYGIRVLDTSNISIGQAASNVTALL